MMAFMGAFMGGGSLTVLQALEHLSVGFGEASEALAEAVFVEFFVGLGIPETEVVGTELIDQEDGAVFVAAKFELEIHEGDPEIRVQLTQQGIDAACHVAEILQLSLFGDQPEDEAVLIVELWVAEFIVFVVKLHEGEGEHGAILDPEIAAEASRGDVADDHFDLDHLGTGVEHVVGVKHLEEVGRNPPLTEVAEELGGDGVVECPFPRFARFLFTVEGGERVFELRDEPIGIFGLPNLFGFAFVEEGGFGHCLAPFWVSMRTLRMSVALLSCASS